MKTPMKTPRQPVWWPKDAPDWNNPRESMAYIRDNYPDFYIALVEKVVEELSAEISRQLKENS